MPSKTAVQIIVVAQVISEIEELQSSSNYWCENESLEFKFGKVSLGSDGSDSICLKPINSS